MLLCSLVNLWECIAVFEISASVLEFFPPPPPPPTLPSPGPQQAFRGVSRGSVRRQGLHLQDGSGQPEASRDRGRTLLRHETTVWTQRHRRDPRSGVPATGMVSWDGMVGCCTDTDVAVAEIGVVHDCRKSLSTNCHSQLWTVISEKCLSFSKK